MGRNAGAGHDRVRLDGWFHGGCRGRCSAECRGQHQHHFQQRHFGNDFDYRANALRLGPGMEKGRPLERSHPVWTEIGYELVAIVPALSAETAAAALAPSAAAAAKSAVLFRTRFVDVQGPAVQLPAV
jgi:hypothetical protein